MWWFINRSPGLGTWSEQQGRGNLKLELSPKTEEENITCADRNMRSVQLSLTGEGEVLKKKKAKHTNETTGGTCKYTSTVVTDSMWVRPCSIGVSDL